MLDTVTLPLFAPPPGTALAGAEPLRRRAGVAYTELPVREILNRSDAPRLPFDWTLNPYRGCEFGCAYCYARDTHGFFLDRDAGDFESEIYVKRDAAASLRRRLRRSDLRGQTIALGTATDPYQPAERHFGVTRSILEAMLEVEGLAIAITTKSPLVLRDAELLERLDRRHALSVQITITTLDPALARRLEKNAPDPRARLRALEALAARGLSVSVNCMPVLPGINDGEATLRPLFAAAAAAGAEDVRASALFLRGEARKHFFAWLGENEPQLAGLYQRLYRKGAYLDEAAKDTLLANFRRLRLEHGFPRPLPARA